MKEARAHALRVARRAYWCDKPYKMTDMELLEKVEESEVKPEDIVRLVGDYNEVFGPNVETCVCALCNDYGTINEGVFSDDPKFGKRPAKDLLCNKYEVNCTEKDWNALSSLEKRFRHIVDVNEGTGAAPERYFISAHGLQKHLGKDKWAWWTDSQPTVGKPNRLDLSTARFFVCDACARPRTGCKRWLKNSDPGRMPKTLRDSPLNIAEQIVLNEAVIFNKTILLNAKENHLSGHVISIESPRDAEREVQLPRLKYAEHIQLAFFGEARMKKLAFDIMRDGKWNATKVRPDNVEMWMRELEMNDALKNFQDRRNEYIQAWDKEMAQLRDTAIHTDDAIAVEMRRRGVDDVAKARPPFERDENDVRHPGAAPGVSNLLLTHKNVGARANDFLRSVVKQMIPDEEDEEVQQATIELANDLGNESVKEEEQEVQQARMKLANYLGNEFVNNKDIIYGSFKHLFPLGDKTTLIGTGSVPEVVTRRLMRFYDPRFARSGDFRNFMFSQQQRHGVCRRVAKLRKKDKLAGLEDLLADAQFMKDLKWASRSEMNAASPLGKAVIDKVLPFFRDTSGALKWSTLERQASKSEMFGLMLTYGAGGYFFTVSPGMKDQRFAMRMMQRLRTKADTWNAEKERWSTNAEREDDPEKADHKGLTGKEREKLRTDNPVECARVYDMLARAFYSKLVGSGLSNGQGGYKSSKVMKEMRRKGAFGAIPAIYGVTEAQHNGGLHTHGIGFLSILGMTLKRFAGKEGTLDGVDKDGNTIEATEALHRVYDVLDSHLSAAMDSEVRATGREDGRYNWVVGTTPVLPKSIDAKQLEKYETEAKGPHAKCTRSECKVETKNGDGTCWFGRLKGELEDFQTEVINDANLTNARVNYHIKCKPSVCLSKDGKCDGRCRFAVLKRLMGSTECIQLESDPDDPTKVINVTLDAPPPDDETWPLPPDHQIHPS